MKKLPLENNQNQKLKKHRRIKSQQMIYSPSSHMALHKKQSLHNFLQIGYVNKNLQMSNVIQVIKQDGHSIKLVFCSESPLKLVKEHILKKLGIQKNSAYFYTTNKDYNFDYRLEEEIGTLDANRKLSLYLIPQQYQQILHKNEQIKQSSQINQYFVYECLSVGGFSKVFLARSKNSGKFYAAKFIDKNLDDSAKFTELIFNQKFINEMLDYPMLVKMHQFLQTKQFYIFILDYCPSGELFSLMKNHRDMTQDQARFYFIQTILGIEHMHSKSIIYRDIKPQNILLDKNGHIKIADFGLSKIMREKSMSYCGSLQYMAPQIVRGHEHSFGVDHYCLGSLLFQMMVGCPPFYNPNFTPSQTKYHIINSQVRFPPKRYFSSQLIDFVNKLLDKNPKTRLGSLGGIKQILSHPWVGKFDRQKFEKQQIKPPFIVSLNQSNFQTTYLPKQSIKQTKQKISIQLKERQQKSKAFKKQKLNRFQDEFSDKLIKKRMKSNQIDAESVQHKKSVSKRKFSTGNLLYSKDEQQLNPYDILLSKNRSSSKKKQSFSSSKNLTKSQSKSLHLKTDYNKNQCETKFNGYYQNNQKSNVGKQLKLNETKKQLQKFRKCTQNTDELKRKKRKQMNANENKQNDDSKGNLNRIKFKYQTFKDKSIRKLFGDFMRYTCTNDTQNNEENRSNKMWKFNRALGDAFPKHN